MAPDSMSGDPGKFTLSATGIVACVHMPQAFCISESGCGSC